MSLEERLKALASKAQELKDSKNVTEEATKMALIVPMFKALGYDVFDTNEFCPEFIADYGVKKGEKVDYAILRDGEPSILIECKPCTESLEKHGAQLFRYYSVTSAKFGILTNGIDYEFYADLQSENKMDETPFLSFNILNISDSQITALTKFSKSIFDQTRICSEAEQMKSVNLINNYLTKQYTDMENDYATFILHHAGVNRVTQNKLDRYKPLVQRAFTSMVNDLVNQKIHKAIDDTDKKDSNNSESAENTPNEKNLEKPRIITTEEEIESFYIVRGLLAGIVPIEDIVHRDTESYFGILYQDNNRKPICRLKLTDRKKQIYIPDADKNFTRYDLDSLNDIYQFRDQLIKALQNYL